jgi:hypothetical protein
MQTNPESAAVEAVAGVIIDDDGVALVRRGTEDERIAIRGGQRLYPQSALDALRGEVERLRKSNELYSFAMNTAGIDELKRRADAAERREAELEGELRSLYRAYVSTLESGRDRIIDLGGQCDPLETMERNDPALICAKRALTKESP